MSGVSTSDFHKAWAYVRSLSIGDLPWLWWRNEMLRPISRDNVYSSLFAAFSSERKKNRINEMHFTVLRHCFSYLIRTPPKAIQFSLHDFYIWWYLFKRLHSFSFRLLIPFFLFFFYVFFFIFFLLSLLVSSSLRVLLFFSLLFLQLLFLSSLFTLSPLFFLLSFLFYFPFFSYLTFLHALPSNFLHFFLHFGTSKNGKTLGKWRRKMCWKQEREGEKKFDKQCF